MLFYLNLSTEQTFFRLWPRVIQSTPERGHQSPIRKEWGLFPNPKELISVFRFGCSLRNEETQWHGGYYDTLTPSWIKSDWIWLIKKHVLYCCMSIYMGFCLSTAGHTAMQQGLVFLINPMQPAACSKSNFLFSTAVISVRSDIIGSLWLSSS